MRLALLVIPAMLMLCPTARAGWSEDLLLPSEIKMKYLEQYAYRLDLSSSQWVAVLDLHQAYKKRYQELRTKEITPWLTTGINRNNKTYAAWLRELEKINKKSNSFRRRMASFDNEMFLKIESILTEEQLERMPRVRNHRQRQFAYLYWGDIVRHGWNRGVLDLGDIIHTLTLTRTEEELIDPILNEYERRLTPLAHHVSEICIDWLSNRIREIVRLGFGEDEVGDSSIWDQVEHDIWFAPKGRRLIRLATQIETLTHNTAKAIEQAFVDDRREEWLDAYVKTAYPRFTSIRIYRRRVADSVESITHMSEDEQLFLTSSVEEYEQRMRDLLDRNMTASNDYWTPRLPGTDEERNDRWGKTIAVWNALSKDIIAIRDWFREQLEQGLGPAAFTQWDATHTRLSTRPDWRPQHTSGQYVRMLYDSPLCISERDIGQVLDRFDLDDETRATVNSLMETYHSECITARIDQLEATNSRDGPLDAQHIKKTLQRDARLIEDLKQTIDSEEVGGMLDWLIPIRHRQQYARNLIGGGQFDPVTFLFDAELSNEQFLKLAPQIDVYNKEVNPIYRQRYDAVVRYRLEHPGENSTNDEIDTLNRRIAVINDRAMRSMTAALPELLGTRLLDTFLRTSHTNVFKDRGQLHQVFQRQSLRETITSDQRQQFDDLNADYISRYAELTNAMVALCIEADAWVSGNRGEPFYVPLGKHRVIEAYTPLHYERDELNALTNVRIRFILTPQQVKAIGGLQDLD